MSKVFYTSRGEAIRLGQKIGAGGEGVVYEVEDRGEFVAKIYYEMPSPERAEKLVVLARLGTERLFRLSAWPVDVLFDAPGNVAGFMMKKISDAEEVHNLHSPKSRLQKFPEASWAFLIYVAANFARAVAVVHEHGLVIGDVNPKNTLVTKKATVFLLDCDSFQVTADGKTYRCEGGFPEYTPPELQGVPFREVDRNQEHDYFGLAVVIFQLLFMGRHPYSGRFMGGGELPLERAIKEFRFAYGADSESRWMKQPPGTLALGALPAPITDLFRRTFLSKRDRPRPSEWIVPLELLAKSLKRCGLHSGHQYYRELSVCPWCGIETSARIRLFNFTFSEADRKRGHFRLDEIWREIDTVEPPATTLAVKDDLMDSIALSEEIQAFLRNQRKGLIISVVFSAVAGIILPLVTDFPSTFIMIVLAGIVARNFAIANITRPSSLKTLFQFHQSTPNDQLTEKVQQRKHEAENIVQQLERNWEKEAGSKRFIDKHSDLRAQKEAYENLAQLREQKLKQLEYATRNLSPQARISVEKEIDGIRLRLEHELGSGPFYLRRLKQEIEISRQRLEPTLLNARRELAQVEKDWDASFKRNSSVPAIIVLIISFFYGSIVELYHNSPRAPLHVEPVSQKAPPQPHIAPQPPLARPPNNNDFGPYYNLGLAYAAQGNWEGAKVCMQRALAFRKNESWDES